MLCNDVVFCSSFNHLFFDQPVPSEDLYVVVYGLPVNVKLICKLEAVPCRTCHKMFSNFTRTGLPPMRANSLNAS